MHLHPLKLSVIAANILNPAKPGLDVLEIACVKIHRLSVLDEYHSWVQPKSKLPEEVVRRTGMYSYSLSEQPVWESIAPEISRFIGDDLIVLAGPLTKQSTLLKHLDKKPSQVLYLSDLLAALPERLQAARSIAPVTGRMKDSAQEMADTLLGVINQALENQDAETLAKIKNWTSGARAPKRADRSLSPFDSKTFLKDCTSLPGVYLMRNEADEIMYVGKAKNLKKRLQSYFRNPKGLPDKVVSMIRQVHRIELRPVGTELEALLLEARLIKEIQPFYNRMIKNYKRMAYMAISTREDYPRVSSAVEMDAPDTLYFGPFPKPETLSWYLEGLNRVFQLRNCHAQKFKAHANTPCMDYEIGLCSGPCAGRIAQAEYRERVEDFIGFLAGRSSRRVWELETQRDSLAEDLEFEKAAAIQGRLDWLSQLQFHTYRFVEAIQEHHCILLLPHTVPEAVRLLVVLQGQPYRWFTLYLDEDNTDKLQFIAEEAISGWEEAQRDGGRAVAKILYEEARILSQWLNDPRPEEGMVIPITEVKPEELVSRLQTALADWAIQALRSDLAVTLNAPDTPQESKPVYGTA